MSAMRPQFPTRGAWDTCRLQILLSSRHNLCIAVQPTLETSHLLDLVSMRLLSQSSIYTTCLDLVINVLGR